jgi:hypothetical protein
MFGVTVQRSEHRISVLMPKSRRQIEEMVPDSLSQAEERVGAFGIVVCDVLNETP